MPASAVAPDLTAVAGTALADTVGALLTIVLIAAVASLIASAIAWAYGEAAGNHQAATRGRTGALIALGAAAAAGAAVAWLNFLIGVGAGL